MYVESDISGAYDGAPSWVRSVDFSEDAVKITDAVGDNREGSELHYMLKEKPAVDGNRLLFDSCGIYAELEGMEIVAIEDIDLSGENPPDGIRGDAVNRIKSDISFLIPRLFEKQWGCNTLYRLIAAPTAERAVRNILSLVMYPATNIAKV